MPSRGEGGKRRVSRDIIALARHEEIPGNAVFPGILERNVYFDTV
jgi:hypothetical protein